MKLLKRLWFAIQPSADFHIASSMAFDGYTEFEINETLRES